MFSRQEIHRKSLHGHREALKTSAGGGMTITEIVKVIKHGPEKRLSPFRESALNTEVPTLTLNTDPPYRGPRETLTSTSSPSSPLTLTLTLIGGGDGRVEDLCEARDRSRHS